MKKSVLISIVFFTILVTTQFIFAAESNSSNLTTSDLTEDSDKVDLAYNCLKDKIESKTCEDLTLSEKTFSVMATGKCLSELVDDSKGDGKCWPSTNCKVKESAQAMIALKRAGSKTEDVKEWILTKNQSAEDLQWFLQVEGNEEMTCSIKYSGTVYSGVKINEDKTISSGAGSCISVYDKYWLIISPDCYDEEFVVSCDKSFQTNLMYKKTTSSVFYVSQKTNSGPAESTTSEKINSQCFGDEGTCDYASTLWAVYALASVSSYDISPFWPYLQIMAEENENILPEGVLYYVSSSTSFKSKLLEKQESDGYWDASGDKFYDTAFALLPLGESSSEKTKSMNWLLSSGVQDEDGCWKGNILNTAFLLYSLWPRAVSADSSSTSPDCTDSGYFCVSRLDCSSASGTSLAGYSCPKVGDACCTKNALSSCTSLGGTVCSSSQTCSGSTQTTSDLTSGQTCCISGTCTAKVVEEETECEQYSGTCVPSAYGCSSLEESKDYSCATSSEICCVKKTTTTKESSSLWIWIVFLILLILLVVLAILFRDKLRPYWIKIKSKFEKGGKTRPTFRPGFPNSPSSAIPIRSPDRRVLPPQNYPQRPVNSPQPTQQNLPKPSPQNKQKDEMEEVLKKLKEMSK